MAVALAAACSRSARPGAREAAQAPPVIVTLQRTGAPVPGAPVVIGAPDGSVVAVLTTDANGEARGHAPPGGSVTVFEPLETTDDDAIQRYTILGVQPGDRLLVGTGPVQDRAVARMYVQLPGSLDAATLYRVESGCGGSLIEDPTPVVELTITGACVGKGGTIAVRALAVAPTGEAIAHTAARAVTIEPSGIAAVELDPWSTQWAPFEVHLVEPPATAAAYGVEVAHVVNGVAFPGDARIQPHATGQPGTASFDLIPELADELRVGVVVVYAAGAADISAGYYVERVSARGAERGVTISLAERLLPPIDRLELSSTDPARPEVSWRAHAGLAATDGALVRISWSEPTAAARHEWWILAPPDAATPIRVPALPDELAAYRPRAGAEFQSPMLAFVEADDIADYAALRTRFTRGGPDAALLDSQGAMRLTLAGLVPFAEP